MKIKILAKKLSLSGIDKSLCSIVNMLSVNHEVTLVQTYKEENGTHKLNDNVKQVFLLSSEKEEKKPDWLSRGCGRHGRVRRGGGVAGDRRADADYAYRQPDGHGDGQGAAAAKRPEPFRERAAGHVCL